MKNILALTNQSVLIKTVAATATPERFTSRSAAEITSIARITQTVGGGTKYFGRVTTSVAHGLITGSLLHVSGATGSSADIYNVGSGVIKPVGINVLGLNYFDYPLASDPGGNAAGSPAFYVDLWARYCVVLGYRALQTPNADTIYIGPTAADGSQPIPIGAGEQYEMPIPNGVAWNLGEFYIDVASILGPDGAVIIYS